MFIPRVYYRENFAVDTTVVLDKTVSHYLTTVLRLKNQDAFIFFNGQGGEYQAELIDKKSARIVEFIEKPLSLLPLHLGQGICRGDRMDYVIQKATELGVTHITPLLTERVQVKLPKDREQKRLTHWQNIAISAAEQCGRVDVPEVLAPCKLEDWITTDFLGSSLVFDWQGQPLKNLTKADAFRLAIGPESGWSATELDRLLAHDFSSYQLGPRILRTETAGIVALSIIQHQFGDF